MPAVLCGGFTAQLLGRAAGRTAEPVEEEYMQSCREYITEQRNVVGRLVAVVFFNGTIYFSLVSVVLAASPANLLPNISVSSNAIFQQDYST